MILLNSVKPYSDETEKLAEILVQKYGVSVLPVNCEQLKREDVIRSSGAGAEGISGDRDTVFHSEMAGDSALQPLA